MRVSGIFVQFYTLRPSIWHFSAVQRKLADFSTGCRPFIGHNSPKDGDPGEENHRLGYSWSVFASPCVARTSKMGL